MVETVLPPNLFTYEIDMDDHVGGYFSLFCSVARFMYMDWIMHMWLLVREWWVYGGVIPILTEPRSLISPAVDSPSDTLSWVVVYSYLQERLG